MYITYSSEIQLSQKSEIQIKPYRTKGPNAMPKSGDVTVATMALSELCGCRHRFVGSVHFKWTANFLVR